MSNEPKIMKMTKIERRNLYIDYRTTDFAETQYKDFKECFKKCANKGYISFWVVDSLNQIAKRNSMEFDEVIEWFSQVSERSVAACRSRDVRENFYAVIEDDDDTPFTDSFGEDFSEFMDEYEAREDCSESEYFDEHFEVFFSFTADAIEKYIEFVEELEAA